MTRALAATVIAAVIQEQKSLSLILKQTPAPKEGRDNSLVRELCYGTLRWYPQLEALLKKLLKKPLKKKDVDIQALLLIGLYQLIHTRIPDHAAIAESVNACRSLKKNWATGMVNGVLRNFQRNQGDLLLKLPEHAAYAHPEWLFKKTQKSWPDYWSSIVEAGNSHPPMTLRANQLQAQRDEVIKHLAQAEIEASPTQFSAFGITLKTPVSVDKLPGFETGLFSVQDEAAQLAAPLLQLSPGMRVLDACAAPGGKTCHILESQTDLKEVVALDINPYRLEQIEENLDRLSLTAEVMAGDAASPEQWWDSQLFDRILLDAPCSATGVIRRNPDIKVLRQPEQITALADLQIAILTALWPCLKPGGQLLYVTCSILPEENEQVLKKFIAGIPDAKILAIEEPWGISAGQGRQLLPRKNSHDGFYYAKLEKADKQN